VETAAEVFGRVDPQLETEVLVPSGGRVGKGRAVLEVRGAVRSILGAERVALNFLQHLSGVATLTAEFVSAVRGSRARILDTRKTTPGLRALEKAAVKAGGGENHRFGLFDRILVKDNHLVARGDTASLREAVRRAAAERPGIRIEIEADRLEQVEAFLEIDGVDIILLDNMPEAEMGAAVRMGAGKVLFEASGGITLENVGRVAATGVDFISIGALTHSVRSVDFSLELLPSDAGSFH
jgi:nicotinate-nucleotide pyrophosphorylase (carboxylating)